MYKIKRNIGNIEIICYMQLIFVWTIWSIFDNNQSMFVLIPLSCLCIFLFFYGDFRIYQIALLGDPREIITKYMNMFHVKQTHGWTQVADDLEDFIPSGALLIWQVRLYKGMMDARKKNDEKLEDEFTDGLDIPWRMSDTECQAHLEKILDFMK